MSLLPERTEELFPTWVELGEESLRSEHRDFEQMYQNLRQEGRFLPVTKVGPYTRYRIATRHLEDGGHGSVMHICRELLAEYPDLVPALDTMIESTIARGLDREAIRLVIERLALVGVDDATRDFLERIDAAAYTPQQLMSAMRADPFGAGRAVVARHFLDVGEPERAWRALADVAQEPSGNDPLRLIRGRTLNALGRHAQALEELESLGQRGKLDGELLEALAEAYLRVGSEEAVEALIGRLLEQKLIDRDATLAVVDRLLERGRFGQAARLLERLDAEVELRGGDVLMHMALGSALSGDRAAASEALERAEAFVDDGGVELLRVLIAIDERDWTYLPELVSDVRAAKHELTPYVDAILALLEERLEAGNQMAESGLRENPASAEWMLLRAAARMLVAADIEPPSYAGRKAAEQTIAVLRGETGAGRDPREILGSLLALDVDGWAVWAARGVERMSAEGSGGLWPAYLESRVMHGLGRNDEARAILERLTRRFPRFGPGWDALLEQYHLQYAENPYHGRILGTRKNRLRAVGRESPDDRLQIALDAASEKLLAGKLAEAADDIQRALDQSEGNTSRVRALLGRLYWATGQTRRAVVEYDRACEDLGPGSAHALVAEFLGVLRKARSGVQREARKPRRKRERLSAEHVAGYLDSLEARFPQDPLIPLERTRIEIDRDRRNPDLYASRDPEAMVSSIARAADHSQTRL